MINRKNDYINKKNEYVFTNLLNNIKENLELWKLFDVSIKVLK